MKGHMRSPFTERASDAIRERVNDHGDDDTLPKWYARDCVPGFCEGASRFGEGALICDKMGTGLACHQVNFFTLYQFIRVVGVLQRYFEIIAGSALSRLANCLPSA